MLLPWFFIGAISSQLPSVAGQPLPRPISRVKSMEQEEANRIIGGEKAPFGRYPYAASLQSSGLVGRHQCGGSLVAPDILLTAAHCAFSFDRIYIGRYVLWGDNEISETFGIDEQFVHPRYDFINFDFDMMLVKLDGLSSIEPVMLNRNPIFPAEGFELTTMGWGMTNATDNNSLSEVLKVARMIYINNERCKNIWGDDVKDDMFCTVQSTNGVSCNGDSGGGVILRGSAPGSDLLVGLTSWGPLRCDNERLPSVSSRVTYLLDWIDSVICQHSASPPPGLNCAVLTFSPSPTMSPTGPTSSPAPTTTRVSTTVILQLDGFPQESGWEIKDAQGVKIAGDNPGTYTEAGALIEQEVFLDLGETYAFTAIDISGDGLCCEYGEGFYRVFLGTPEDGRLMVYGNGTFGGVERHKFVVSETDPANLLPTILPNDTFGDFPVKLTIRTDSNPEEITWSIVRLDLPRRSLIVNVPPGTYGEANQEIIETALVDGGGVYQLSIADEVFDGVCCESGEGSFELSLGGTEEGLKESFPGSFSKPLVRTFVASPSGRPQADPPTSTNIQTVNLLFDFDSYPDEVGWIILVEADESHMQESTSEGFNILAFGPPRPYGAERANRQLVETIVLPTINATRSRNFRLIVHDTFGDGLCCSYGNGFYRLFLGPIIDGKLLAEGTLEGKERETIDFIINGTHVPPSGPSVDGHAQKTTSPPSSGSKLLCAAQSSAQLFPMLAGLLLSLLFL